MGVVAEQGDAGRNETQLERCDRNLVELLQEMRVVQTGVQVLFAFLLMAPLTPGFADLSSLQRVEYFVTLALSGVAALLLIAPTAYHRLLFPPERQGVPRDCGQPADDLWARGGRPVDGRRALFVPGVLFGQTPALIAGGITAATAVTRWRALPPARRRALSDGRAGRRSPSRASRA